MALVAALAQLVEHRIRNVLAEPQKIAENQLLQRLEQPCCSIVFPIQQQHVSSC